MAKPSRPISSWLALGYGPRRPWPNSRDSDRPWRRRERISETKHPAYSQREILRAGPTRSPAKPFASSISWLPSGRAKPPPVIFLAQKSDSTPCLSSGLNNMTFRSAMWDMPSAGTKWKSSGSLAARDCTINFYLGGKKLAVATLGRDISRLLKPRVAFSNAQFSRPARNEWRDQADLPEIVVSSRGRIGSFTWILPIVHSSRRRSRPLRPWRRSGRRQGLGEHAGDQPARHSGRNDGVHDPVDPTRDDDGPADADLLASPLPIMSACIFRPSEGGTRALMMRFSRPGMI